MEPYNRATPSVQPTLILDSWVVLRLMPYTWLRMRDHVPSTSRKRSDEGVLSRLVAAGGGQVHRPEGVQPGEAGPDEWLRDQSVACHWATH